MRRVLTSIAPVCARKTREPSQAHALRAYETVEVVENVAWFVAFPVLTVIAFSPIFFEQRRRDLSPPEITESCLHRLNRVSATPALSDNSPVLNCFRVRIYGRLSEDLLAMTSGVLQHPSARSGG